MLRVAALEIGNPIALPILMERGDFSLWLQAHGKCLYQRAEYSSRPIRTVYKAPASR
jgi:hypothetical protein